MEMIKCPNCGKEIVIDYEDDIEATMWNFYGDRCLVEMFLYCKECEKSCKAEAHYNMTMNDIKVFKRR